MTKSEVLARIIGPEATLRDVELAFSGQHPDLPFYTWIAQAELTHEIISIAGLVFENGVEIGHYRRRLFHSHHVGQAIHEIMELQRVHRDRDIAKHHYTKSFAFYNRVGIRYISMEAENEGL